MLSVRVFPGAPRLLSATAISAALDAAGHAVLTLSDGSTVSLSALSPAVSQQVVAQIGGSALVAVNASGQTPTTASGAAAATMENQENNNGS